MKYSLRSLMIAVTILAVAIGGRIAYLRGLAAFHLNETFRLAHTKHSSVHDAVPDVIAATQHGVLARRFHAAVSHPWTLVDTMPPTISPLDAQLIAEDVVAGDIAKHFIPDDDSFDAEESTEDRAYTKLVTESYQRYLREHRLNSSALAPNPPKN